MINKHHLPNLASIYSLKEKLFALSGLEKLATFLFKKNIKANHITVLSILIGIFAVINVFENQNAFIACFVLNRALDALDGYYARKFNMTSTIGNNLDHWGDVLINTLFLVKTYLTLNEYLALIALVMYLGEFIYLSKQKQTHIKFPPSMFPYLYLLGMPILGLQFQIFYQIISDIYFTLVVTNGQNHR